MLLPPDFGSTTTHRHITELTVPTHCPPTLSTTKRTRKLTSASGTCFPLLCHALQCTGSHGWCCDGVAPDLPGTQPAPLREMKSYLAVKATPDRWISAPGLLARARWRASVMKTKQTRTRRDCDASAHVDLIEVNSVPGALQLQRSLCPSEAEARGQTDAFHSPMWQHITGI